MVIGFLMVLGGGLPMAVGQVLPVFVVCAVICLAGFGVVGYGKKVADRA